MAWEEYEYVQILYYIIDGIVPYFMFYLVHIRLSKHTKYMPNSLTFFPCFVADCCIHLKGHQYTPVHIVCSFDL